MNHPQENASFRIFTQLNGIEERGWMSSRSRMTRLTIGKHFQDDTLQNKLVQAMAAERLLPVKEILECFEFFARVRKDVRAKEMVDLCCGHGLVGILFAVFERKVEKIYQVDQTEPESREKLFDCIVKVAPWIQEKVIHRNADINKCMDFIKPGTTVLGVHACGILTDKCIDIAINLQGKIAVMPCCYPERRCPAPLAIQATLGNKLAFDIDRTYRLENAGYHVRWTTIPAEITPMNRIITAKPTKLS